MKEYRIVIAPPETLLEKVLDKIFRWVVLPTCFVLGAILITLIWVAIVIAVMGIFPNAASSHDWYVGQRDPVTGGSCCTTSASAMYGDCGNLVIEPGVLEPVPEGYRIRLTVEQARKLNPLRTLPVDTIVPEERIQDSEDGNFHMCIPSYPTPNMQADFFCFFRPGML